MHSLSDSVTKRLQSRMDPNFSQTDQSWILISLNRYYVILMTVKRVTAFIQ